VIAIEGQEDMIEIPAKSIGQKPDIQPAEPTEKGKE
jgi:hypothetical protein